MGIESAAQEPGVARLADEAGRGGEAVGEVGQREDFAVDDERAVVGDRVGVGPTPVELGEAHVDPIGVRPGGRTRVRVGGAKNIATRWAAAVPLPRARSPMEKEGTEKFTASKRVDCSR